MAIRIDVVVVVIDRVDENTVFVHFVGMLVAPCFKDRVASEFAQCQVSGQMSGKMRYSLQTWPRRAARAGGPPRVPGGPAAGPRPRVRPQPPAASPPQVVWEWSDAEKSPRDALRPSETTTFWSRGPKSGDFPHVLQVHPQSGVTERVSG